MTSFLIIVFGLIAVALLLVIGSLMGVTIPGISSGANSDRQGSLHGMVQAQRSQTQSGPRSGTRSASIFDIAAKNERVVKVADSRLTLAKKLRYAQWTIPGWVYYASMFGVSMLALFLVTLGFGFLIQITALFVGPIFVSYLLNTAIYKRFKAFDKDYPPLLMSLVGLLKTGMNPVNALQAACEGLEEGSLCKSEVQTMLERMRIGLSEDQSIGAFGEDIYHEEIELFVQALLLSRRVGGNLSDTLDRLARQVRKRQYFRESANAAVGQQRMSIWVIIFILVGLKSYLWWTAFDIMYAAYNNAGAFQVWQFCFLLIVGGIFWLRQVTKIRV